MLFSHVLFLLTFAIAALASPLVKRSTPPFYLVAVSNDASLNLKPVLVGAGPGGPLSLTTGDLTTFHLNDNNGLSVGSGTDIVALDFPQTGSPSCGSTGEAIRLTNGSTNKCAATQGFELQSDTQNSQLGAQLVFNFVGGFFSCGDEITYSASGTPSGCTAVGLWTVPAS